MGMLFGLRVSAETCEGGGGGGHTGCVCDISPVDPAGDDHPAPHLLERESVLGALKPCVVVFSSFEGVVEGCVVLRPLARVKEPLWERGEDFGSVSGSNGMRMGEDREQRVIGYTHVKGSNAPSPLVSSNLDSGLPC